jgi:DNA-3-methyladenine glycosylase II
MNPVPPTTKRITTNSRSAAIHHLCRVDPVMKALIKKHGVLPERSNDNSFETLARIIVGQQLSGRAAATISARVKVAAGGRKLTARRVSECADQRLREAGVSRPKVRALRSLVEHVETRKLRISKLVTLGDEQVFESITQVKGMGPWSAQMYLIFVLGRLDVFPDNDLGIRKAIALNYRIDLTPESLEKVSSPWRPYRTVASLYLWRSLDNRQ